MGYARILKDNNGKPSGYRECDGEVAFMPEQQSYENIFHRVKIDLVTMEVLSHDFIKDKERVYRRGVLLRGITPEGFHVFNPAYIGNHQIIYTPYGDAKIAHPETFEILDDGIGMYGPEGYGRDADFDSFRVTEDGNAEDNYHYFFHGTMIKRKYKGNSYGKFTA